MNKILLLNGSPKYKDSASEHYLDILYNNLDKNYYIEEERMLFLNDTLKHKIKNADILVISTPLYADNLPSHVLDFLIKIGDLNLTNKMIYLIINCGFLEGIHNIVAFKTINNFCNYHHIKFMGGLGIGGGPIGYRKVLYNYSIYHNIKQLSDAINYQKEYKIKYISPLIPRFIYIKVANIRWKRAIKSFK